MSGSHVTTSKSHGDGITSVFPLIHTRYISRLQMPTLTYSGRPQSKKWVRSARSAAALPQASTETSTGQEHDATSSASGPMISLQPSKKLPQLSGPKPIHPSMALHKKTSWKRPRDEDSGRRDGAATTPAAPSGTTAANTSTASRRLASNSWKRSMATDVIDSQQEPPFDTAANVLMPPALQNSLELAAKPATLQHMMRRGAHSLQLKRKETVSHETKESLPKDKFVTSAAAGSRHAAGTSHSWRRPTTDATGQAETETDTLTESGASVNALEQSNLTKIAPYKLVQGVVSVKPRQGEHAIRNKKKDSSHHGPSVKRIKLSSNPQQHLEQGSGTKSDENDSDRDGVVDQISAAALDHTAVVPETNKQLTDFAYRSLSTKHKLKSGDWRRRGDYHHGRFHNALVRLDPSKTPICPTFLRGKECTNERCTLRHDVPLEYCRPVCSFFQHQGMCLRENCPFRHIKLERDAIPCPSFEMLGYCQDEQCPMMHNTRRKKTTVAA